MKKKTISKLEKISVFYDRHENVLMLLMILLATISVTFHYPFRPYDLIWNFGNMYKLFLGYKIYEEVAIIITPLCFYIGELFFKLFGANYLVYNIYNLLIEIAFYTCFFAILKKVIKNIKIRDLILGILMFSFGGALGTNGPNYIPLSAIFIMLLVITNLYMKNSKWRRVVNGILAALAFLSYQKAGAAAVLTIIIYEVFNKEETKKSTKFLNLCISGISMIVCVGAYIVYLLLNNNLQSFLDIAILGIGDFTANYAIEKAAALRIILIGIITIAMFIILIRYKKNNDYSILLFGANISSILYVYPIINEYHSCIWILFLVLFIINGINMIFDGFELTTLKQNFLVLGTIVLLAIGGIAVGTTYFISFPYAKIGKDNIYFGSTITEAEIKEIEEVDQYIDNKKTEYDRVIVFSSYAMLYDNTFKENNKFFDLPNRGNFGKNGEQTLIDEINNMKNTLILVQDENSKYELYQFPKNVRKYIEDNYERIDKLQNYDIYVINNK